MSNDSLVVSISKLGDQKRDSFDCGSEPLNNYLKMSAGQDYKKSVSVAYVMCLGDAVIGYYTLSANSIDLSDLPSDAAKKLPKYPKLPVTLLGRLAVDVKYKGKGYGTLLLADALRRVVASSTEIGSFAVVVDAKDVEAEKFYIKFGFVPFEDTRKLYLPIKTILAGYKASEAEKEKKA